MLHLSLRQDHGVFWKVRDDKEQETKAGLAGNLRVYAHQSNYQRHAFLTPRLFSNV